MIRLQSPYPVVSLQFSTDNQFILTSTTHGPYQELILWDLPNFRYMREDVKTAADKIQWFDSICSGSEDVRAIWENANLTSSSNEPQLAMPPGRRLSLAQTSAGSLLARTGTIVNLSCHRLIRHRLDDKQQPLDTATDQLKRESLVIASDARGFLRIFRYPCYDIQQGFYEVRVNASAVNCCRFLAPRDGHLDETLFVSSSLDGSICLWKLQS